MESLEVGRILGRAGGGRWVQVHDFWPQDEGRQKNRGRLVAVASLSGAKGESGEEMGAGREILARLHELYYGNEEGKAGERLKGAVETTVGEAETGETSVELVAATVVGGAMYVVVYGGFVWIKRGDGKEGWVVKPQATNLKPQVLSGWVGEGDVVVLGNGRFWESVTVGTLKATLPREMGEITETLGAILNGRAEGEGGGGVVIRFKSQISPKLQPPSSKVSAVGEWRERWGKLRERLKINRGPVYVEYRDKAKLKKRLMIGGVAFLVVLLSVSGVGQWRKQQEEKKNSRVGKLLVEIEEKFAEADGLLPINPTRSRQLLSEVGEKLRILREEGVVDKGLDKMEESYRDLNERAAGIKKVSAREAYDMALVREDMEGEKMVWREEKLVVLDTRGGRVIEVDPVRNKGEVVAGQLGEAKLIAGYPGKTLTFSDKGILEIPNAKLQVPKDEAWGEIGDMEMWAGNVYLLDRDQIWVYRVTESGYGKKSAWLSEPAELGESMTVDGNIWVVIRGQGLGTRILKFTRGVREEEFEVEGGEVIYTDGEAEKLYLLDPSTSSGRVLVYNKNGEYESQYVFEEARKATDLVVNEKGGRMYLVGGSKIWEVQL